MARGQFNPQIGAYFEPASRTVWSRELSGWVNQRGDLFRRGQPTPFETLPPEQRTLAAKYMVKAGVAAGTAPPPPEEGAAPPVTPQMAPQMAPSAPSTSPSPPAILSEAKPSPIAAFARSLGAMK
jgi:hypothetical protein